MYTTIQARPRRQRCQNTIGIETARADNDQMGGLCIHAVYYAFPDADEQFLVFAWFNCRDDDEIMYIGKIRQTSASMEEG